MSPLLSRARQPSESGRIQQITPESAQWRYVGFEVYELKPGQRLTRNTEGTEVCLVLLSGRADVTSEEHHWPDIGRRDSLFDQTPPFAVYLPPGRDFEISATTDLELAVCRAPAKGQYPPRLIRPEELEYVTRGTGTNERRVCNILFNDIPAERLLVVEVITPNGHWSSYPPHKHDTDAKPRETQLEETYYHRLNPSQGFAFQRVYTDDRSLDETMTVEDKDVVMVPKGYHPVGAPHGYDLYYLNTMAGPERTWIFQNDPAHEWMLES
ncbi:5-deoxy-glucuronate isomerase [Saccharospirillum salsuginis]|uniref:5-deoxy-glucuronate isomerase n=1 Tax=Saccharospirillum salsuginis TaxID=418750 RepID=A0A918KJN1_9GAMM|nr:5-deoxy-glucuronate isomerase [Saccharospirillum salsuginis]GGX65046.1 5-deoxy-glucuronate isomerase [Saccharospirillum salsuginis]